MTALFALVISAAQTPQLPHTPIGGRLAAFVISANAETQTDEMVLKDHFAPRVWKENLAEWTGHVKNMREVLIGAKLEQVERAENYAINALYRSPKGLFQVRMAVGEAAPNLIEMILVQPVLETASYEWENVTDLAAAIVRQRKIPGLAIAVGYDNPNEPIGYGAAGVREFGKAEPLEPDDRLLVGSIGKAMTCSLIAALIERGELYWDMTLAEALPHTEMLDGYKAVTLEQVMRHRSGLPQDQTVTAAFMEKYTDGSPTEIRARYAADILMRKPIGKPDEKSAYSNGGYSLLGHIAEQHMGRSYEALMKEFVFDPIGMKSAVVAHPGTAGMPGAAGLPAGHAADGEGWAKTVIAGEVASLFAPAGVGVACSISDLCRFAQAHLQGVRGKDVFLKARTIQRLHTPGADGANAMGWLIRSGLTQEPYHWHNGSDGSMIAEMAIWPEMNLAVVAIANSAPGSHLTPPFEAIIEIAKRAEAKK